MPNMLLHFEIDQAQSFNKKWPQTHPFLERIMALITSILKVDIPPNKVYMQKADNATFFPDYMEFPDTRN
jgi:hypothetical protein